MSDAHRLYEIRCPVHGFIKITDWEREIINHPVFQRLRRIRQLAWTDQVYPGAMHTRFEHSLGVLHVASRLFDAIVERSGDLLRSELAYTKEGLERDRSFVRLCALLHDVGHSPFSHAAEELFPFVNDSVPEQERERYKHEDYSAAIVRTKLRDVIENHPFNQQNVELSASTIANLLEGKLTTLRLLLWRELISGQLDADRIDYLLRDSLHTGVDYGKFDWRRLIGSVRFIGGKEDRGLRLGVSEGGYHAAEGMVLARYYMFTQVYFHKTRVAYNIHLRRALAKLLPTGVFPKPDGAELDEFLRWDDWRVLGALASGRGGEHGQRLVKRDHYREVYHSPDCPVAEDLAQVANVRKVLGNLFKAEETAATSTYKVGTPDIPVVSDNPDGAIRPLSEVSPVVHGLRSVGKVMLFCRKEDVSKAKRRIQTVQGSKT